MTMKPYPSNLIVFDVDERSFSEDLKLDIIRSWTHIGEILVRTHAGTEDGPACNVIRVKVKYGTRRYLQAGNPEADDNWSQRIEQHLLSSMRKISSNAIAFNRRRRKDGLDELSLDLIEFELERGALTLAWHLDSNGALPVECAHMATEIRAALATGTLGQAVRVVAPSQASWSEQLRHSEERRAQREREERQEAQQQAEKQAQAAERAEEQAEERFMESPELTAQVAAEQAEAERERADSPLELAPLSPQEWDALYGVHDAEFAVDYRRWDVIDADGSSREFDADSRTFL